jgi:phage baseplate assembly protein W
MFLSFPYHIDPRGRSAQSSDADHLTEMIEQVLFTAPGERVNRPDFGCGLLQLVFAPNSDTLAAALQTTVQGALQQWLGALIAVEQVTIDNSDSTLSVTVQYSLRSTQQRVTAEFTQTLA